MSVKDAVSIMRSVGLALDTPRNLARLHALAVEPGEIGLALINVEEAKSKEVSLRDQLKVVEAQVSVAGVAGKNEKEREANLVIAKAQDQGCVDAWNALRTGQAETWNAQATHEAARREFAVLLAKIGLAQSALALVAAIGPLSSVEVAAE